MIEIQILDPQLQTLTDPLVRGLEIYRCMPWYPGARIRSFCRRVDVIWIRYRRGGQLLPFSPDSVVTHGDFSLDNLIFDEGKLIGCIDVGRVGIADRYQDLAILWNCLGEFSPSLQKRLFQKYGIDNPDMNKLQFHLMLDEFF